MKVKKYLLFIISSIFFLNTAFSSQVTKGNEKLDVTALIRDCLQALNRPMYQFWVPYPIVRSMAVLDYDGDGIPDRFDDCPYIPGVEELKGCPPIDMTKTITVACPSIVFTDEEFAEVVQAFAELEFDLGKIVPGSCGMLDKFIEMLKLNSKWRIDLSVYVEDTPDRSVNLDLSKRRFEDLRRYLIKKGIDKKRITGNYFGDTMPVLDLPHTRLEIELSE